jgi:hypothetical protein
MNSTIKGFVMRDEDGRPVARARVELQRIDDLRGSVRSGESDPHGWFAFHRLAAGRYRVEVASAPEQRVSLDPYSALTLEFVMNELADSDTGVIAGKVVRSDNGYAIENASVMILSGPTASPDIASLTDTSGTFSFSNLAAGEWILRAIAPSGHYATRSVTLGKKGTALTSIEIDFHSDGFSVSENG